MQFFTRSLAVICSLKLILQFVSGAPVGPPLDLGPLSSKFAGHPLPRADIVRWGSDVFSGLVLDENSISAIPSEVYATVTVPKVTHQPGVTPESRPSSIVVGLHSFNGCAAPVELYVFWILQPGGSVKYFAGMRQEGAVSENLHDVLSFKSSEFPVREGDSITLKISETGQGKLRLQFLNKTRRRSVVVFRPKLSWTRDCHPTVLWGVYNFAPDTTEVENFGSIQYSEGGYALSGQEYSISQPRPDLKEFIMFHRGQPIRHGDELTDVTWTNNDLEVTRLISS